MTSLEEIRNKIKELKKYRKILCTLIKNQMVSEYTNEYTLSKDKPKDKKLEVRKKRTQLNK